MFDELPADWQAAPEITTSLPAPGDALVLAVFLLAGGLLALVIRLIYRYTTPHVSADSIARVFPLLTMVTIAVIAVVKSSLALSLGLVGALSIVRFRAAIKDPEELVYLFLCIGVGLCLGAEQPWLAIALVVVAGGFAFVAHLLRSDTRSGDAYMTIVGDAATYFSDRSPNALEVVRELHPRCDVHRCEVDGDLGQLRVLVTPAKRRDPGQIVAALRERLPGCEISYIAARSLLAG